MVKATVKWKIMSCFWLAIRDCLLAEDVPLPYSSKDTSQGRSKDGLNDPMSNQDKADTLWQHRAEMALATALKANRTITYAELANAAKIPNPRRIHKLTKWLENSMREDHEAGKPLRATLVISRNRGGLPAPGFFILCEELGLYHGDVSGENAAQFHQTEITNLLEKNDI